MISPRNPSDRTVSPTRATPVLMATEETRPDAPTPGLFGCFGMPPARAPPSHPRRGFCALGCREGNQRLEDLADRVVKDDRNDDEHEHGDAQMPGQSLQVVARSTTVSRLALGLSLGVGVLPCGGLVSLCVSRPACSVRM